MLTSLRKYAKISYGVINMKTKVSDFGTFAIIFAIYFVALSIIGSPVLSIIFVLIYRMLENGLMIFLPFFILRKKPEKKQVFTAIGLIIALEFFWYVINFISAILYSNIAAAVFFTLILYSLSVAFLLLGTCFIQTMKFTKPDFPLVVSTIVYLVISLVGSFLTAIKFVAATKMISDGTGSILDIMDTVKGGSDDAVTVLSGFFTGTFVRSITATFFIFFLVKFIKKRESAHDPVPE
jgi:hypothetical protein